VKGIVFTEFLEMVEDKFGLAVADRIIAESELSTGGAYTAVGTYDHQELARMLVNLGEATSVPVPDLLRTFGRHLFGRFYAGYPRFFEGVTTAFDFMENIESYIHPEVRKLYPDAQLPSFSSDRPEPNKLTLVYRSERRLADFAEGLIMGCGDHFNEKIDIQREDLSEGAGAHVRFLLTKS
jgi:hypothetical protein